MEVVDELIDDVFGWDYLVENLVFWFDLVGWLYGFGFVEIIKNCNFFCVFCFLIGEG